MGFAQSIYHFFLWSLFSQWDSIAASKEKKNPAKTSRRWTSQRHYLIFNPLWCKYTCYKYTNLSDDTRAFVYMLLNSHTEGLKLVNLQIYIMDKLCTFHIIMYKYACTHLLHFTSWQDHYMWTSGWSAVLNTTILRGPVKQQELKE